MNELDNYPRPWRVTTTGKQRRTGGGYNYHIRAANDMYVAEKLMVGEDGAALIVESVNEREEPIAALKTQLATMAELYESQSKILHTVAVERDALHQRAEVAEAELAQWRQAVGLLTTLHPQMMIDPTDSLGMARQIEAHVLSERQRAEAAEVKLAKAQDDQALNRMLDETLQELADALAEIISLRRSEGHNADRAIGRLQALRPDSEYLRQ